jgi:hypothetical protein
VNGSFSRDTVAPTLTLALSFISALIILSFLAGTSADADLWGHLAFGRDIVHAHALPTSDPYSFTSDVPWINHEWLAEAAMWCVYAIAGSIGLVVLKLALACLIGGMMISTWHANLSPLRRDALVFATAIGVWPLLVSIRPQVFSLALFAALLWILDRAERGRPRTLFAVPLLFAIWVNVHGGWIVGAATLTLVTACSLLSPGAPRMQKLLLVATACAAAVATLCNPYGTAMLAFLADTVRPTRADIVEWQSVGSLPVVSLLLWLVPLAVALFALSDQRRSKGGRGLATMPLASLVIPTALAIGSFQVARLVGFFALAVAFTLVRHVRPTAGTAAPAMTLSRSSTSLWQAALLSAVLICGAVAIAGRQITVDGAWVPEPEAEAFVNRHQLAGKMLTWFDYGEYAIWYFSPRIRVSMDGRRETVYSSRMRQLHTDVYTNAPGALAAIAQMNPDYIWLPRNSPTPPVLLGSGWFTIFQGSRSLILGRHSRPVSVATVISAQRAFPGP